MQLYPPITPYRTGWLPVDTLHTLYFEECGNPTGHPILFLHGGPGAGIEEKHRQYFDPTVYRIILFDQRGSGKSQPHASLEQNSSWDLVEDIEKLRLKLEIEQWMVFGGSWGSTLALVYAILHTIHVEALILRGICLCRPLEIHWLYQYGAHLLFPDIWEKYIAPIPEKERADFLAAFYRRLTSEDPEVRKVAANAWMTWEAALLKLQFDPEIFAAFTASDRADAIARLECHYFIHNAFFPTDNWILENIERIHSIPGVIIHGRYDVICPLDNAWQLHRHWASSRLEIIPDAGHAASEPAITAALIRATDALRGRFGHRSR
jgi:proline iminopeptidase